MCATHPALALAAAPLSFSVDLLVIGHAALVVPRRRLVFAVVARHPRLDLILRRQAPAIATAFVSEGEASKTSSP